jgi:hypothetical protein
VETQAASVCCLSGINREGPFSADLRPFAVSTRMDEGARTMLASLAMAEVHALQLSPQDGSERTTLGVCDPFRDNLRVLTRFS